MKTQYIKPETTAHKLHGTNVMLVTSGDSEGGVTEKPRAREYNFGFFEEEELEENE